MKQAQRKVASERMVGKRIIGIEWQHVVDPETGIELAHPRLILEGGSIASFAVQNSSSGIHGIKVSVSKSDAERVQGRAGRSIR